jgi:hypothetical protein
LIIQALPRFYALVLFPQLLRTLSGTLPQVLLFFIFFDAFLLRDLLNLSLAELQVLLLCLLQPAVARLDALLPLRVDAILGLALR